MTQSAPFPPVNNFSFFPTQGTRRCKVSRARGHFAEDTRMWTEWTSCEDPMSTGQLRLFRMAKESRLSDCISMLYTNEGV
jgi:hypothetical protein